MSTPRRSRVLWAAAFAAALALFFAFSSSAFAADLVVGSGACSFGAPGHATIQAAINAAAPNDVIKVCNGTYAENPSIVGKNLTVIGESRAGVVINPPTLGSYGIDVQNADVTLKSFTMNGHGTGDTYGLKLSGDTMIADVQDVTVDNFYRSGMDFSGLNGLTLKNVTSTNADWGVGVALSDVSNAVLENITTSGNLWGGIAIYTRAYFHPASVADNIVLQGTNSIGEVNAIYVELDPFLDPSTLTFKPATNISLAGFPFMVTNTNGRNFFSFAKDAAGAAQVKAFQEVKFAPGISSITQVGGQMNFWPTGYTVQAAIDAAAAGSTVVVGQGTFTEQLTINKKLALIGSGAATIIKSPATLTAKSIGGTNRFPVVFVESQDATIKNLVVDGDGKGNANNPFIGIAYWNAGGVIDNVEVKNIQDTPFSGVQHGVAIYARVDDDTVRSMTVRNSTVRDFQKNGINFYSGGTTSKYIVNASGNKVFGKGVTALTAQNGIQFWRLTATSTLKGVVEGNTISGIVYDNTVPATKWVATSLLNYYADLDITNNTIIGAHMGIYNIDAPARINGNRLQIIRAAADSTDGYGIVATDPPHAVPSPMPEPGAAGAGAGMASADAADAVLAVTVANNQVVFVGALATEAQNLPTVGIEADAGYGADSIALTANGNTVTGFDYGFYFGKGTSAAGVFTSIAAHNNRIYGNRLYGMYNDAANPTANAENNWWGAATGPVLVTGASAASVIPAGGDNVSTNVDFDPWTTSAVLTVVDAPHVLTAPANTIVVPVRIDPPAANYSSLGFSIDYDQACLEIANLAGDVVVLHADLEKAITHDAADSDGELDVALWDAEPSPIPNFVFPAGNFMTIQFTLKPGCNTANPVVVNFSAVPPASCGLQTGFPATDCSTLGAALLVNFNPTNITLTPQSIDENAPSPYTVGTLAAVDADGGPTYTFTKVAGAGDTDNGAFAIVGNELRLIASPNFEVKSSYSVRVKVDDGRGGSYEKAFTVSVTDVNEPPTDITLSNNVVAGSAPVGTVVGTFGVVDEDGSSGYTFAITGGTGDTYFDIVGNELRVASSPIPPGSYTLVVTATGPGGLSITETFTIIVEDTAMLSIADDLIVRKGSVIAIPVNYVANGNTATSLVFDVTYDAACLDFLGGANAASFDADTVRVTLNGAPVAGGEVTSLSFYAKNPAEGCTGNRSDSALTLSVVTYQKVVGSVTIPLAISPDSGNVILYKNSPRGDCNSNDVVEAGDFVAIVLEYFDVDATLDPTSFWLDAPLYGFDGSPRGCDANANATIDTTDVTCTVLVFFGDSACTESGPLSAASVNPVVISMPGDLAVSAGKAVAVPVALESLGNDVAAVGFILQLDKSKVTFDAADGDGDGIPDAVKLNVPASFAMRSVVYDAAAGQIKVAIADLSLPLATLDDGALATVTLQGVAAGTTELQFVHASAGNTAGQSLTVIEKIGNGATSTGRAYLSNIQQ